MRGFNNIAKISMLLAEIDHRGKAIASKSKRVSQALRHRQLTRGGGLQQIHGDFSDADEIFGGVIGADVRLRATPKTHS